MFLLLKKFVIFLMACLILGLVVYYIEPPKTWATASLEQIFLFFIPLLFVIIFFLNLFLSYLPHSFIIALGCIMLVVLFSINLLTWITGPGVIIVTLVAVKLFPKLRYPHLRLTRRENIPKLSKIRKE